MRELLSDEHVAGLGVTTTITISGDIVATLNALALEVQRLRRAVRDAQWSSAIDEEPCCPWCEVYEHSTPRSDGSRHAPDCVVRAIPQEMR
jgi:thiamine pyrophosphate-dependent acetolactate synthase large subunit-like protein